MTFWLVALARQLLFCLKPCDHFCCIKENLIVSNYVCSSLCGSCLVCAHCSTELCIKWGRRLWWCSINCFCQYWWILIPNQFQLLQLILMMLTLLATRPPQQLSPTALENLRTTLMVQVSTRQCLATASQHHTALLLVTDAGCNAATDNITASTRSEVITSAMQFVRLSCVLQWGFLVFVVSLIGRYFSQHTHTHIHHKCRSLQLAATGSLQQDSTGSVRSFKGAQTASASSSWEKQIRKKSFVSIQRYKVGPWNIQWWSHDLHPMRSYRKDHTAELNCILHTLM